MLDKKELTALLRKATYEELKEANSLVISMLRGMDTKRAHTALQNFNIGDEVQFSASRGRIITGTIEKLNLKSASVKTANGGWRVSPSFLRKLS